MMPINKYCHLTITHERERTYESETFKTMDSNKLLLVNNCKIMYR